MDESSAKSLLDECLELYRILGRMDEIVSNFQDHQEKAVYAKFLGELIGNVTFEFIRPLTQEHPSLKALFE